MKTIARDADTHVAASFSAFLASSTADGRFGGRISAFGAILRSPQQNGILTELMSMSEDDRNELLAEAKDAHFSFLNKISELKSGQDRIECLQDIDAEKQKLLAIHKLWGAVVQRE